MAKRLTIVLFISVVAALTASSALAERFVVVNGARMSPAQVAQLDRAACSHVPDGRYWVTQNGTWGYEGVPVAAGVVGEQCYAAPATRRRSLSERGMLFSTRDFLR